MSRPSTSTASEDKNKQSKQCAERGRSAVQLPLLFPSKLYDMLQDCENANTASDDADGATSSMGDMSSIVSWLPDGKSFRVHNVKIFSETILPSYFNQSKYKSFQRQLNLWDFDRITYIGPEKGAYFHEKFQRDKPFDVQKLRRARAIKKVPAKERRRLEKLKEDQQKQTLQKERDGEGLQSDIGNSGKDGKMKQETAKKDSSVKRGIPSSSKPRTKDVVSSHPSVSLSLPSLPDQKGHGTVDPWIATTMEQEENNDFFYTSGSSFSRGGGGVTARPMTIPSRLSYFYPLEHLPMNSFQHEDDMTTQEEEQYPTLTMGDDMLMMDHASQEVAFSLLHTSSTCTKAGLENEFMPLFQELLVADEDPIGFSQNTADALQTTAGSSSLEEQDSPVLSSVEIELEREDERGYRSEEKSWGCLSSSSSASSLLASPSTTEDTYAMPLSRHVSSSSMEDGGTSLSSSQW